LFKLYFQLAEVLFSIGVVAIVGRVDPEVVVLVLVAAVSAAAAAAAEEFFR
jgi:hypothetical protein